MKWLKVYWEQIFHQNHPITKISEINSKNYNLLIIPGGVKSMEKVRQNKKN